jgi:hypothetical protein
LLFQKGISVHLRQSTVFLPQSVYEAVVRLDRIQPVIPHHPGWKPEAIALSQEALGVLMAMLRECFGAPQDEDMKALREIVQDALPDEAKVHQT